MAIQFLNTGYFPDDAKLTFGTGSDLEIYHDGSHSEISESGTGDLRIRGDSVWILESDGTNQISAYQGTVKLYKDGVNRLETTSAGVGINGDLYQYSGKKHHFDWAVSNDYHIYKNGTALTFNTGGTYAFNTGDVTFAGNATVAGDVLINNSTISTIDSTGSLYIDVNVDNAYGGRNFRILNNGTTQFNIDSTNKAEFFGDVSIPAGGKYHTYTGSDNYITYNSWYIWTGSDIIIRNSSTGPFKFQTNGANDVLTLDSSQEATFHGDILTNTDSSSDIGKTAIRWANIWVDNINGATPRTGDYLPLSAGSSYPLTGDLYLDGSNQIHFVAQAGESNTEDMRITRSSDKMYFTYGTNAGDEAFYFDSSGDVTFEENITFSSGSDIIFPDNLGAALEFKEGSNLYMRFITTNGSEAIQMGKATTISNSLAVNSLNVNNGALSISSDNSNHATLTESGTGDFTIYAVGDITLDAGDDDIYFKDAGAMYAYLTHSGSTVMLTTTTSDEDFYIRGNDGGVTIDALRLDMSDSGWAHFNAGITVGAGTSTFAGNVTIGAHYIGRDADNYINFATDNSIKFVTNASTRMQLDQSQFYPSNNDGVSLGVATLSWSDLFLADGAVINFDNGEVTMTHSGSGDFTIAAADDLRLEAGGEDIVLRGSSSTEFGRLTNVGGNFKISTTGYVNIDAADDITLDAGGNDIRLFKAGVEYGKFKNDSGSLALYSSISNEDIFFRGDDGGVLIDALKLDMSDAGTAIFNNHISIPDYITHYENADTRIGFSGTDTIVFRTDNTERASVNNSGFALSSGARVTTILDEDDMATDSATALATQQSIKKYVDDSITGTTVYQGTWDPDISLNAGYGDPNLSTASLQVNGYYYICSADGGATPNGSGTSPSSWHTGDWVIWNDDLGASGQWQKLDNSSVISGAGTAGRVAKWDGSGASETLTNSGIQDASNAVAITINGNEEVGIGTTTPVVILHTQTSSNNVGRFESTDGVAYIQINDTADSVYVSTESQIGSIGGNVGAHDDNLNIKLVTGDVGIGTTSPNSKLEVVGDIKTSNPSGNTAIQLTSAGTCVMDLLNAQSEAYLRTTTAHDLHFRTTDINRMVVKAGGNVGIGTTSPGAKLDIVGGDWNTSLTIKGGSSSSGIKFLDSDNNVDGYIYAASGSLGLMDTGGDLMINCVNDNSIRFSVSASEKMRLTTTGLGINTTSPTAKLEVNGGIIAGGKTTYTIVTASVTTTGTAVAGVSTGTNGQSSGFIFTCFGGDSGYQRIVYSCKNVSGTWDINKDIDEGANGFDVTYAADGSDNITFTFKSRSGVTQYYAPKVTVEAIGDQINQSYIN